MGCTPDGRQELRVTVAMHYTHRKQACHNMFLAQGYQLSRCTRCGRTSCCSSPAGGHFGRRQGQWGRSAGPFRFRSRQICGGGNRRAEARLNRHARRHHDRCPVTDLPRRCLDSRRSRHHTRRRIHTDRQCQLPGLLDGTEDLIPPSVTPWPGAGRSRALASCSFHRMRRDLSRSGDNRAIRALSVVVKVSSHPSGPTRSPIADSIGGIKGPFDDACTVLRSCVTCVLFFAGVTVADASTPLPYPTPPVTASTTVTVLPTSADGPSSPVPAPPAQAGPLAYTGTGFNVGLVAWRLSHRHSRGAPSSLGGRRIREPRPAAENASALDIGCEFRWIAQRRTRATFGCRS